LPLFPGAEVAASPGAPTEVAAKPRVRWLVGHGAALCVGNHPIEQLLRRAGFGWLIDLTGWMERRILAALDDDTVWPDFPRELFRSAPRGAPSLSPIALFNLVIVGALQGATGLRELERMASLDLRGMWILGGWCPDHSTIGRFMAKLHGRMSNAMFEHLTIEALRAVHMRVCDVSLDGTVIAAATSRYQRLGAEAVAQQLAQAQAHVRVAPNDPKKIDALAKAQATAAALKVQQEARVAGGRDASSVMVFSNEPEVVLHKTKEGAFHPAYIASATAAPIQRHCVYYSHTGRCAARVDQPFRMRTIVGGMGAGVLTAGGVGFLIHLPARP